MENDRVYWHAAFTPAMKLELREDKDNLEFETEYQLNSEPIMTDLLIIKKDPGVTVKNEIGRFFKGHNILEYKGPNAGLNIDVFFKGIAYASLYKSRGPRVDSYPAEDITLTFVREAYPRELFKRLRNMNISLSQTAPGIYNINAGLLFDTQIVVTRELDEKNHLWIKALTNKISESLVQNLVTESKLIYDKGDKENAHSVLEAASSGNKEVFTKLWEVLNVSSVLMELLQPDIDKKVNEAVKEKDEIIAKKDASLAEKDASLAEKDASLAEKDARIKELEAQLASK